MMVKEAVGLLPDQFMFAISEQGRRRAIGKQNPSLGIDAINTHIH